MKSYKNSEYTMLAIVHLLKEYFQICFWNSVYISLIKMKLINDDVYKSSLFEDLTFETIAFCQHMMNLKEAGITKLESEIFVSKEIADVMSQIFAKYKRYGEKFKGLPEDEAVSLFQSNIIEGLQNSIGLSAGSAILLIGNRFIPQIIKAADTAAYVMVKNVLTKEEKDEGYSKKVVDEYLKLVDADKRGKELFSALYTFVDTFGFGQEFNKKVWYAAGEIDNGQSPEKVEDKPDKNKIYKPHDAVRTVNDERRFSKVQLIWPIILLILFILAAFGVFESSNNGNKNFNIHDYDYKEQNIIRDGDGNIIDFEEREGNAYYDALNDR